MSQTIKIVVKRSLLVACLWLAPGVIADGYDRKDFNYRSYKPNTAIGFYTNQPCDFINIDHIVSLKDAHASDAASWSDSKKKTFANDKANHVPSCGRVNSSKGSAVPKDFLRRSRDGRGLDYKIVRWCEYVAIYKAMKTKYQLTFANNDRKLLSGCAEW
jgi:hypothetical protein|tara:strand:- start:117 stop:593 length:477 start_codon:yes stop_codon:yes gene_type:complete